MENPLSKSKDAKLIENLVIENEFWRDVGVCLKGAYPLIKVLRLVDSDDKPPMRFLYEEMGRAKEKIKDVFHGVKKSYEPIWEIIDGRWQRQLHRPLHAAGYYLNPRLHYSDAFKTDLEVKRGLYECLERMAENEESVKIDAQLEMFKSQSGFFGSRMAKNALQTKTPAQWWESYGDECPELQKFAIRVLSLTCSSSGCERNWSAFEMVHTKRRNRLKQETMNDVVYVMSNSKLAKKKKEKKTIEYDIDDLLSDDDWLVDELGDSIAELDENDLGNSSNDMEIPSIDNELDVSGGRHYMEDYDDDMLNGLLD